MPPDERHSTRREASFRARVAVVVGVAAVFFTCATPPPDDAPAANAPRIVVPVASLQALDRSPAPWMQRWAGVNSPFWLPTAEQARYCEVAAARAFANTQLAERFQGSAAQFAGITRDGDARILVHSVCSRIEKSVRRHDPELQQLVFPPIHECGCFMSALCDPATRSVSQVDTREPGCGDR